MILTEQLSKVEERYEELDRLMADPDVVADYERVLELAQERSSLEEPVSAFRRYQDLQGQLSDSRELLAESDDPELAELAELEIAELENQVAALEDELRRMLLPKDRNDEKNVIVEIRAGAGGDEAGIFAADLLRMYTRWADDHKFKTELMSVSDTGVGGIKEAILEVRGKGAYSRMKYESGVHRVQRVPTTESQGRIHTSTATVAVLPEAEDVEIEIAPNEMKVDVFRSSGPGGQSVNTTDSAVRLTHLPTGIVISCQDEKSQLQNRLKAVRILKTKLYDVEMQKQLEDLGAARRSQVGSGDRSEKIRTYNFPQGRVTDHRINKTLFQLEQVLNGELDEFIEDLAAFDQAQQLQAMGEEE
ncbi:MAG: peptide chain release factor 1 [Caldilineaceae bacterium SB0664_bin_27]|uniref:Peptide chain release factor 1 n=1 Tax=Caldilineaceae bacterium SB0664_bin_27 TaxID=2605260 RepID=A0A6B0YU80_9CHLR|nr:peptide chain release factor 1 [Caldilineaceae bacterium SB0664_bin_27]